MKREAEEDWGALKRLVLSKAKNVLVESQWAENEYNRASNGG